MRLVVIAIFVLPLVVSEVEKRLLDPLQAAYQGDCDRIKALNKNDCGIAGVWQNQLTSVMELSCKDGHIDGRYNTAVGNADDYYNLTGKYVMTGPNKADCVLGWVVAYENKVFGNSNSTAAWSGIHYAHEGIIRTHWVLTHWQPSADHWRTTSMNHDDFNKLC